MQRRWEEEQERLNKLAAEGVASEEASLIPALHVIHFSCAEHPRAVVCCTAASASLPDCRVGP